MEATTVEPTVVVPESGQTARQSTDCPVMETVPAALYPMRFVLSFIAERSNEYRHATFGIVQEAIAVPVTAVDAVAAWSMMVFAHGIEAAKVAPVFGVGSIRSATWREVAPVAATATVTSTEVGTTVARFVRSFALLERIDITG